MAERIDGRAAAAALRQKVAAEVTRLAQRGLRPGLAIVTVGDDPASAIYRRNLTRQAREAGFVVTEETLALSTSQATLAASIERLNAEPGVHGILLHLPLPDHIDASAMTRLIDPGKDVDGVTLRNMGRLAAGQPTFAPSTPLGCLLLLREQFPEGMRGKRAVVVGRSNIVGRPMAALLLREDCTVTICHSRTVDIESVCRQAEILVVAVGRPRLVTREWVREGAVVIDVGINPVEENGAWRLVGDVDYDDLFDTVAAITPVPGGVGPMTIAALLLNTLAAAKGERGAG